MENNKTWDILTLSGNSQDIEILSSYIFDKSLGGYISDDKYFYYFHSNQRGMIENILNKYTDKFQFSFLWEIQDYQDWHLSWKDNFQPIEIDNDLIIVPDWDQNTYHNKHMIKIRPGMAFGTGHHETTFLMLKHLIKNIKADDSVLDLGSGSGILSIASYIYNASKITSIEYDEDCRNNFLENLEINGIKNHDIDFIIGDVLSLKELNYDIILANINKNIIKELIPNLKNTNAKILLSGLLDQDQSEIESLLKLHNMNLIYKDQYNEWILMVVQND
tara:strand:+ start:217 stop:1044 length:828 start_codon:yes stop_codon:yes gene_type:complete